MEEQEVASLSCWGRLAAWVNSVSFEACLVVIILVNSVLIGVEMEIDANHNTQVIFLVLENVFTLVFVLELLLRTLVNGCQAHFCGPDWRWAWFDLMVVGVALLEAITNVVLSVLSSETANITVLRLIRMLRVTRLARVFRVTRIIRFITPLRSLLFSIMVTLRHLIWSLVLLGLIIYVFGLLFTRAVMDATDLSQMGQDATARHWADLFTSMMTLFQAVTNGVSWGDCSLVLLEISPFFLVMFIFYIILTRLTCFAVLNVVTGTFCQSAIAAASRDPDLIAANLKGHQQKTEHQLKKLFETLDCTGSGQVSYAELEHKLQSEDVIAAFQALKLEVNDAWTLFKLLDQDQTDLIDVSEFVVGCKQLRGEAATLDLAKLAYEMKWLVKRVAMLTQNRERGALKTRQQRGTSNYILRDEGLGSPSMISNLSNLGGGSSKSRMMSGASKSSIPEDDVIVDEI